MPRPPDLKLNQLQKSCDDWWFTAPKSRSYLLTYLVSYAAQECKRCFLFMNLSLQKYTCWSNKQNQLLHWNWVSPYREQWKEHLEALAWAFGYLVTSSYVVFVRSFRPSYFYIVWLIKMRTQLLYVLHTPHCWLSQKMWPFDKEVFCDTK